MIAKLREINEKFKVRVTELESIVSQAVEKATSHSREPQKNYFSHRIPQVDSKEL
jgi:phage-related protein